jgi:hypothetical protein
MAGSMTRCRDLISALSLAFVVAALAPARAHAQHGTTTAIEGTSQRDDHLRLLGEHFYASGEYYRAVGIFEELRLFSANPALKCQASLRIAMAYHHGLQIDEAVRAYDQLLAGGGLGGDSAGYVRLLRVLARAQGAWRGVREVPPRDLIAEIEPLARSARAPYQALAGYHLARLWLAEDEPAAALAVAESTAALCRLQSRDGCASLPRIRHALAEPRPRHRSGWIGAMLSAVVPGLGALYEGSSVNALYYFCLTVGPGIMAWEVHASHRGAESQLASFYALTSIATIFYLSGIVQGALGARRFNDVERLAYRQAVLRDTETPLPLERTGFWDPPPPAAP